MPYSTFAFAPGFSMITRAPLCASVGYVYEFSLSHLIHRQEPHSKHARLQRGEEADGKAGLGSFPTSRSHDLIAASARGGGKSAGRTGVLAWELGFPFLASRSWLDRSTTAARVGSSCMSSPSLKGHWCTHMLAQLYSPSPFGCAVISLPP